jgi:hypothetical protein
VVRVFSHTEKYRGHTRGTRRDSLSLCGCAVPYLSVLSSLSLLKLLRGAAVAKEGGASFYARSFKHVRDIIRALIASKYSDTL